MSKDLNMASAPSPSFGRETRRNTEDRGFIPGKGHPDIRKTWPNVPSGPVVRPNPLLRKGE